MKWINLQQPKQPIDECGIERDQNGKQRQINKSIKSFNLGNSGLFDLFWFSFLVGALPFDAGLAGFNQIN